MADLTDRFKLRTLGPGDRPQDDGYAFTDRDIRLLDKLLEYVAERHHHTGESFVDRAPNSPVLLSLETSGGYLPAGLRVFYRWALVDELGFETAASPVAYIDTPPPVADADAAALSFVATGGELPPGQYGYMLAAYKDADTLETRAVKPSLLTVNLSTSTTVISLDLPPLPAGADGFNIFRKSPGSVGYFYLASTSATSYDDDGSVELDATRRPAIENLTNSHNVITIDLPEAVPDGFHWRLYRTFFASNWDGSLLEEILEIGATPVVGMSFEDVGESTRVGAPLSSSMGVGSPPKIRLTDATDVQGFLPPGRNIVPYLATFVMPGPTVEGEGAFTWVCEFAQADVVHMRAHLGSDRAPASQDLIADVHRQPAGGGPFVTLFTDQGDRPTIPVAANQGSTTTPAIVHLEQGDTLRIDVDQDGGGATPTDDDLTLNILLMVQYGSETESWVWAGV